LLLTARMDAISIRSAVADDAEALAALSTQLGYPSTPEQLRVRLQRVRETNVGEVFVAVDSDARVVGWAHAAPRFGLEDEPTVELAGLVVDEAARGAGVGVALLRAVEAWARAKGIDCVRVHSNTIRERAHRFYRREGYGDVKRQFLFKKIVG
jgi:GNAT superfamily N-acetyltransferase